MNLFRYAFKNIFRNLFLSLSSILTIGLLVFFVNILLLVVTASEHFIESVNNKIAIVLTFQDWYDDTQVRPQEFITGVSGTFSWVTVEYISRESALEMFSKRNLDLVSIIENPNENPLPNSVRISQISLKDYEKVDAYIQEFKEIFQYDEQNMSKRLVNYKLQYEQVSKIVNLLNLTTQGIYVLIGLFLVTVFIMIHTVIRNFTFFLQDEVRIIELVGGKPIFIYGPFVIQGVIYTMFAVLFVAGIFMIFANSGASSLPESFLPIFTQFYELFLQKFFMIEMGIAILIGTVSAYLASYKYIHSTIWE